MLKSHGQDYLVGNRLSRADIRLVELMYYIEELDPSLLANFPLLKVISLPAIRRQGPISHPGIEYSDAWPGDVMIPITVQGFAASRFPKFAPRPWFEA